MIAMIKQVNALGGRLDRSVRIAALAAGDVASESAKYAGAALLASAAVPPIAPVAAGLYLLSLPGEIVRAVDRAAGKVDANRNSDPKE